MFHWQGYDSFYKLFVFRFTKKITHSIISDNKFDTTMHSCIIYRINFLSWKIQKVQCELHILHEDYFICISQTNLVRWCVLCNKIEYLSLYESSIRNKCSLQYFCLWMGQEMKSYVLLWIFIFRDTFLVERYKNRILNVMHFNQEFNIEFKWWFLNYFAWIERYILLP